MKSVAFIGNSLDALRTFPDAVRQEAGFQIDRLQRGLEPDDWKPMKTVGSGVREIRLRAASGAYRVIYAVQFGDAVYILHAFVKKTQTTAKRDLELTALRFRQLMRER